MSWMPNEPAARPCGWLRLGAVPAIELVEARLQLHWAAQLVSAVGTTLLPAAADDSHTNLEWSRAERPLGGTAPRWVAMRYAGENVTDAQQVSNRPAEPGVLAGRLTNEAPRCRAALRPADLRVFLLDERGVAVAEHALHGMTLGQGLVWLEQELAAFTQRPLPRPLRRRALDLPDHAVGRGGVFAVTDGAAFDELGRWYANADQVLRALAARTRNASAVRCWPHHFDIATLLTLAGGRNGGPAGTIGIGMSPGDTSYAEPYWYVTPWPYPDQPRLPELDGDGHWHRAGWLGAVLTGSQIAGRRSAEAQAHLVQAFLGSAVDACRALLSP